MRNKPVAFLIKKDTLLSKSNKKNLFKKNKKTGIIREKFIKSH